jgi:hypothetical protein
VTAGVHGASCLSSFDPASVRREFPPGADELVHQLVDLAEVLGDLPEPFQRCPEALGEGIQ